MPEGYIQALAFMFARKSRDINSFGTLLRVMQWTSHCVSWQIDFVGVLFGLWPRFLLFWFLLFALFFRWRNASLAGGFAGRRVGWFLWLCVVLIDLPAPLDMICPCTNIFSAYAHVRTEPLARHRPHSRKEKKRYLHARTAARLVFGPSSA